MKVGITDFPAYKRIDEKFENGQFKRGTVCDLPIYTYREGGEGNVTPGHYVDGISYSKIKFCDVPEEYRTREFFVKALSGAYKDIVEYVKAHLDEEFDREFFKDHIVSDMYALEFEENCFEYMPLDYIDEEMVSLAMITAIKNRYVERRGDFDDWFYSVAKRKPEVLTQDFWTLGARLFAARRNGKNEFLEITPKEYRTEDYYIAMCLENDSPVMEDFPKEILTTNFLIAIINLEAENIRSFSAEALEQEAPAKDLEDKLKFWQAAMLMDGYVAQYIPLNDERVEFFLKHYDKDSSEYNYGFKDKYKRYLRKKEEVIKHDEIKKVAAIAIDGALSGMRADAAINMANASMRAGLDYTTLLPIEFQGLVPEKYCKKYDTEEYLKEIYQKLGIKILGQHDSCYYDVTLPKDFKVENDSGAFSLIDDNEEVVLKYLDVGPFYDRSVYVKEINCSL